MEYTDFPYTHPVTNTHERAHARTETENPSRSLSHTPRSKREHAHRSTISLQIRQSGGFLATSSVAVTVVVAAVAVAAARMAIRAGSGRWLVGGWPRLTAT